MRPLGRLRAGMPARAAPRAHAVYKAELRDRLVALEPRSLLDVGCGEGTLLIDMSAAGCPRCVGLDVEAPGDATLPARGIELVQGAAEALPFSERSFDVVVLEYTAHHLADLDAGLREAARVAIRAVVILEPWYDLSVPSQAVARDYDEWCKRVDRHLGLIHNPCPSLGELAATLESCGYRLDATHRLILRPLPVEQIASEARSHLERLGREGGLAREALERLLVRASAEGISDDGALLLVATTP